MKKIFTVLFFFCLMNRMSSQGGELSRYDCNYSKEIVVPFNYFSTSSDVKPLLNQVVFYTYRDQFTYWYKISVKEDMPLQFSVSAIGDSDSYVVYVYQYDGLDFCTKLYNQKIKPITTSFDVVKATQKSQVINQQKVVQTKKEHVYYISVLNTSINNCGHDFNLNYGTKDTLRVKALHLPCVREVSSLSVAYSKRTPVDAPKDSSIVVAKINEPELAKKDTVIINPIVIKDSVVASIPIKPEEEVNTTLTCLVKDGKKFNLINAKFILIDLDSRENRMTRNAAVGKWESGIEKNKTYKVKCTAIGYKDFELVLDLSHGNVIELLLEPLKVGDNFIMKSIYFHPNTYALKKESSEELQKLLSYLLDNPTVNIEIQGHTNGDNKIFKSKAYANLGEEWNFQGSAKKLSLKRSEAIKKYLVNNGVAEERLIPEGYGGSKYIVKDPETMEEGQRNIRVEVVILKN